MPSHSRATAYIWSRAFLVALFACSSRGEESTTTLADAAGISTDDGGSIVEQPVLTPMRIERGASVRVTLTFRNATFDQSSGIQPRDLHVHVVAPDSVATLYWSSAVKDPDSTSLSRFVVLDDRTLDFDIRIDESLPAGIYMLTANVPGRGIIGGEFHAY